MNRKIAKTITYRLSASLIAQAVGWAMFQSVDINLAVLIADGIQSVWYYIHEGLWNGRCKKQ